MKIRLIIKTAELFIDGTVKTKVALILVKNEENTRK